MATRGIDVVPVQALHERLHFGAAVEIPTATLHKPLPQWNATVDDAPVLGYLFEQYRPHRHLEFGTRDGTHACLCLGHSDATVWTIERPPSEAPHGGPTDALPVGHRYRSGGFSHRVSQILCDSRDWDISAYPPGFFDSALIQGGATGDTIASDTQKALSLVRPGGLILWHGFCPDPALFETVESVAEIVDKVASGWQAIGASLQDAFWIQPSFLLAAIRGSGATVSNLLTGRDLFCLHNDAAMLGDEAEFRSDSTLWGYSVSFPVSIPAPPSSEARVSILVDLEVTEGMVGVGVMDRDLRNFLSSEVDVRLSGQPVTVELPLQSTATHVRVMVRQTSPDAAASRFRLRAARMRFSARDERLLSPRACPDIPAAIHRVSTVSRSFEILVSHSSRSWNAAQCDRAYLAGRYARTGRFEDLPPFDALPPNSAPYHGLLSVFHLDVSPAGVSGRLRAHHVSRQKVMHACLVGSEVVVCFDAGLAVFARDRHTDGIDVVPDNAAWVTDPWFGGLHTVLPVDERTCLVSSSGADAILWVDVPQRRVVRRWRLPAARYGANYPLDETTWLSEHYIPNDLQLGHLNGAAPDGNGGVFCSVLGQGDIGHVHADGRFELLVSGHVGCHGVRYDQTDDLLYFSDSCGGRLMRVDGPDAVTVLFNAGSRWLHDAVYLGDGMFLLTAGDTNRLLLVDSAAGRLLAEWDFSAVLGTVQFLSLVTPDR